MAMRAHEHDAEPQVAARGVAAVAVDAVRLAHDLEREIRGDVRFGASDRAMYASDAGNYRLVPIGVVRPRDAEDVVRTVAVCRRHGAPIVARGGGTGIPGQTVNTAVVIDFSRHMNRLVALDPDRCSARVEPGIVLDELRKAAGKHGLTFGPDPATHSRNTLGGMIANNSCGIHSMMAGETSDNVDELDVVLVDGTRLTVGATPDEMLEKIVAGDDRRADIYRRLAALRDRHAERIRREFPDIPRRVSGYNLTALLPESGFHVARALVGSECTCALVLEARVRLVPDPPARALLVLGYPDIFVAADHVVEPAKFSPVGLEALDDTFFEYMEKKGMSPPEVKLPDGHAWLLVEFGGRDRAAAEAAAHACMKELERSHAASAMKLFDDPSQEKLVWTLREEGLGATAKVPGMPENHEGWEDASVPPARLGAYLREFKTLTDRYGYQGPFYGHFGQGCVHTRLTFDLATASGLATWRDFLGEAADLVVRFGGSLSGEHGDGQSRGPLLGHMFSPEMLDIFREFKSIWDPDGLLNPGKLIDADRVDSHLREGAGFELPQMKSHFHYPEDRGNFAVASARCVGAAVCRRLTSQDGVMCPSYLVTREEKHSTRGRARLLNEMVRREVIHDGWKSEEVREALDLCLSCKGCKHDCPVQVDMATYKAEFLSHYYSGRLRPRYAYASGLIHWWAEGASLAPAVVNWFTQTPGVSTVMKRLAGYSRHRRLPPFARHTFRKRFAPRGPRGKTQGPVILWADTFNDHFTPAVAHAAVTVLEDAGYEVRLPPAGLCCGRPLYDYGMLDLAARTLRHVVDGLREPLRAGIPVVGLEPSCISVFRDELVNLCPGDDARLLASRSFLLSEFLAGRKDWKPPHLGGRALVHAHCHQRSLLHFEREVDLLRGAGATLDVPESGCCGMAGSFGYEDEHYEVGLACGERVLLPAVRSAAPDTLLVADGFSCREMIVQETGRTALHFAEALARGIAARDGAAP